MGKKHKDSDKEKGKPEIHNPADEGVDHNLSEGTEENYNASYIDKQEARGNRGEDNEDTTD